MAKYHKGVSGSSTKRKKIEALPVVLEAGSSYIDELIRARVQKELQEALEAERDEIVGRAWYKHHAEGLDKHYRNGYADPRLLTCGCGTVQVQVPRLRQRYESKIVVGVNRKGQKKLLALEEGYRESEESWTAVFRDVKRRRVRWIGMAIGDGIGGLWKSLRTTFPMAAHQRCWVHKMRNILDKVPKKAHDEVLDALREMYRSKSYEEALRLRAAFIRRYRQFYPKAVESLLEAGEALFTYMRFPKRHWIHLKTTNPIESLFSTVRLRTRAARRLRTRMGTVCLVFQLEGPEQTKNC